MTVRLSRLGINPWVWGVVAAPVVVVAIFIMSWTNSPDRMELPASPHPRVEEPRVPLLPRGLVDIANENTDQYNKADTEPSIAVNPNNPQQIAVLTFSEGWDPDEENPKPEFMAPIWKSDDSGKTWRKVRQIPCPKARFGGPADQMIAFDTNGKLLVAEMTVGDPPRCYVFRQTANPDGPLIPGSSFGYDQPLLATNGANPILYCSFLEYGIRAMHAAGVAVSSDSGKTVTRGIPGTTKKDFQQRTTRIAVGPKGEVYLLFRTREGNAQMGFEDTHFWLSRSDNCGKTWHKPVAVHGKDAIQTFYSTKDHPFGNPKNGKTARVRGSDAWMAVHPENGHVYVAFVCRDDSGYGQIYVTVSTDRGENWSKRCRVTDGKNHAAYPEIAVAKNGTAGVLYIDYDDSKDWTNYRHRFARSFDSGKTWTDRILQEINPNVLQNADSPFLWGDYQGLTVHGETFYGVFTGESIGRRIRQFDPIFFVEKTTK